MLRGVGLPPLGGLTPLKLTVFSKALNKHLIRIFILQKLFLYQNLVQLQSFMFRGVGMMHLGGLTSQKLTPYISVNTHFAATFA